MCRCLSLKNKVSPTTTLHTVVGQVKILDVVEDDVINKKSNYRLTETNVGRSSFMEYFAFKPPQRHSSYFNLKH